MAARRDNQNSFRRFTELVRRACEKLYPGIGRFDRVVYARVVRVSSGVGRATAANKLWSVDVEILGPDLELDPVRGTIKDVPIDPLEIDTQGRAMFSALFPGIIIRLGWMYGRRDLPYVVSVTSEGQILPYAKDGNFTDIIARCIVLLSRVRSSAVGPVPMTDLIELQQLLLLLPTVSFDEVA